MPKIATAFCVHVHCILTMSCFGIGESGAAVSHLTPKAVRPAVPRRVPPLWLGGGLMGRALTSRPLLSWWTASLQLDNGLCEIGNHCCLLLVSCNQLVNCIIFLD